MIENEYFTDTELACSCCGENRVNNDSLRRLIRVRERLNEPMVVTSGYRCESYNNQIGATQTHATGKAFDVRCSGKTAWRLMQIATEEGFTGIGVKQNGEWSVRFLHLDDLEPEEAPRPTIWSY